jgi:outer membrane protein OmpA-like peptidoglycan-associated protein
MNKEQYNEDLSYRRASAVQDYLTARNLNKTRMPISSMGERCQLVPESTRELNRRVDFHRLQTGESCPMDCSD